VVNAKLIRAAQAAGSENRIHKPGRTRETFDFQCALMSLPLRFDTELNSIPKRVPYLKAEKDLVVKWKARLGEHGFKIGIAWQGNPHGKIDCGRSIPVMEFLPLQQIPGVRLISLQKQHGLDQLAGLPADTHIELLGEDFDGRSDAFVDTAAVIENLDLVITSDTSVAHWQELWDGHLARPQRCPRLAVVARPGR